MYVPNEVDRPHTCLLLAVCLIHEGSATISAIFVEYASEFDVARPTICSREPGALDTKRYAVH